MLNQVGQNQTIVDGPKAIESSCKHWSFRCLFHFLRSGVNAHNEAKIALEELGKGQLQVTDVMLGDTTFGKEDFVPEYEKAGGFVLTPNQLPEKNRSWKNDLYDYRKETIELLFQRIIQAFDLKKCQVKGKGKNGAFILASIWTYQICGSIISKPRRIRRRLKNTSKMLD